MKQIKIILFFLFLFCTSCRDNSDESVSIIHQKDSLIEVQNAYNIELQNKIDSLQSKQIFIRDSIKIVQNNNPSSTKETFKAQTNILKTAFNYINKSKDEIVSEYGTDYQSNETTDGMFMSYLTKNRIGLEPVSKAFIFSASDINTCSGLAMYFDYTQLDDVIFFMDSYFQPIYPPSNVSVSFFRAWKQEENGNTYVWKLTKTDKLFFLTIRSL